jgi:hypothetical protein
MAPTQGDGFMKLDVIAKVFGRNTSSGSGSGGGSSDSGGDGGGGSRGAAGRKAGKLVS